MGKTKVVLNGQIAITHNQREALVIDPHGDLHICYMAPDGEGDSESADIATARAWMSKHRLGKLDVALCAAVADRLNQD